MKNKYDIIVIGGGPSGITAAITAAKGGADVLLIERDGYVGGMSTAGLLNLWCGAAVGGLFEKISAAVTKKRGRRKVYNPETLKGLYLSMLSEAGVNILLHSVFISAETDGGSIKYINVLCGTDVKRFEAKVYIDSTGNGAVAKSAGVPYTRGRESDGLMQPMSLEFAVGGVDESTAVYPTFGTHPEIEQKMHRYVEEGKVEPPAGHVILIEGFLPGTAFVNMTNATGVDGTDSEDLTAAELLTRRQVPQIVNFLRECVPGYENCCLLQTANTVGVRETLHFKGLYTLTETDIINRTVFDDWIVPDVSAVFGNHNLKGSGSDENNLKQKPERYTVPYRSILPVGVDNLLLNGRNISGTHMAHASYRVMPICMAIGEGAGMAAAQSMIDCVSLCDVDIKKVQKKLVRK